MDDSDLYGLSFDDEGTAAEKAQALATALLRTKQLGNTDTLIGGQLAGLGNQEAQQYNQGQQSLLKAGENRLLRNTEAQRNAALAQYHNDVISQRQAEEERKKAADAARPDEVVGSKETADGTLIGVTRGGEAKTLHTSTKKLGKGGGSAGMAPGGAPTFGLKPNQLEKEWGDFSNHVGTSFGRGNLNVKNQETLQKAEALEQLLNVPDLNSITEQQKVEAATALAGLVARGGAPALAQVEHLTPESYMGKFSDFKQKLLNEPQGAQAGAFLKNMLDTAAREKALVKKQIHGNQLQSLPMYARLRQNDKQRFNSILKANGIDPSAIADDGSEAQAQPAAAAAAPALNPGEVLMYSPDGKPHAVPEGQVQASLEHKWRKG